MRRLNEVLSRNMDHECERLEENERRELAILALWNAVGLIDDAAAGALTLAAMGRLVELAN